MKRVLLAAVAVWLGGVLRLAAQNPTQTPTPPPTPTPTPGQPSTVPAGVRYATEGSANVNGVRVKVAPDGSVWFLEASADRVGRAARARSSPTGSCGRTTIWGPTRSISSSTATNVWILESGQSQIAAGRCTIARLDTVTNQVTEWVIPGSIPAAFYRGARRNLVGSDHGSRAPERQPRHRRDHRPPLGPDDLVLGHGRRRGRRSLARGFRQQPHREVRARSGDRDVLDVLPPGLRPAQSDADRLRRPGQALALADLGRPDGPLRSRRPPTWIRSTASATRSTSTSSRGTLYVTSGQAAAAVNIIDPNRAAAIRATLVPLELEVRSIPSLMPVDTRTFPVIADDLLDRSHGASGGATSRSRAIPHFPGRS